MLRHELLKLTTTRWVRVSVPTVVLISMGMAYVLGAALGDLAASDPQAPSVISLALRTGTAAPILAGVLGAWSLSSDIRDGVVRATLLARPSRLPVLSAKVAATCLVAGAVGVACALGATAAVTLSGHDVPVSVWVAGPLVHGLATMAWGVVGLVAAVFVRPVVGAVVAALGWPLLGEPLVAQTLSAGTADLLPFRSVGSLYAVVDEVSAGATRALPGVLPMLGVLGVLLAVAAWRFRTVEV